MWDKDAYKCSCSLVPARIVPMCFLFEKFSYSFKVIHVAVLFIEFHSVIRYWGGKKGIMSIYLDDRLMYMTVRSPVWVFFVFLFHLSG